MKIYYFQDASAGFEKFSPYFDTIRKLIERGKEAHGLNFEKLKRYKDTALYSIRLNDADRILLIKYQGKYCLVDVVLHHDYKKSRFFNNPSLLKSLLSGSGDLVDVSFDAMSVADEVDNWVEVDIESDKHSAVCPENSIKALEYQQGRLMELNIEQERALQTSLPAIVSGPAGSGKSSLALSMLARCIREHGEDEMAFPVLYVSQSPYLVDEMRRIWQEMIPDALVSGKVIFKTYNQMLAEALHIDEANFVDEQAFFSYYSNFVKKNKIGAPDPVEVWKECRIRSGYLSDEAYFELGHRQSGFEQADREFVCRVYHAFLAKVAENGHRVPVLDDLRASISSSYKLFIVDEAQDFSYGQLYRLNQLSRSSIIFFLGDHQILFDGISRLTYLKSLFHGHNPAKIIVLDATYRCSESVITIANALIDIKYRITGGASDKLSTKLKIAEDALFRKGAACRFQLKDKSDIAAFAEQARLSPNCAVITLPQYVDEARRLFGAMVFTPVQVKGLEFDRVILWRLLDCDEARRAASILSFSKSPSGYRAKAGSGDDSYESFCNSLITSATRARNQVLMFENNAHSIAPILTILDEAFHEAQLSNGLLSPALPSSSTDWLKTALELHSRGLKEQALRIFIENLGGTVETFDTFIAAHIMKPEPGILDAAVAKKVDNCSAKLSMIMPESASASSDTRVYEQELFLRDALSNPDSKSRSALLPDVLKKENLLLLRHMSKDLFYSIPSEIWLMWLGKKKNSLPLLLHLAADAENGLFVLQRILALKDFVIPDSIWNCKASSEHKHFSETSLSYWLLINPEGQIIFRKLLPGFKKEMLKTIISYDFLITAPPERKGMSPLAMLIATKPGLDLLNFFINRFLNIFKKIPAEVWSSPHPVIRSKEEDLPLTILNSIQAQPNGVDTLKLLRLHLPNLREILGLCLKNPVFDEATIKTLYGLGFDPNKPDKDGNTFLHFIIKLGKVNALRALHECNVDLNEEIITGITPLCFAITLGQIAIVEEFGRLGIDVNRETTDGKTAAYIAAESGNVEALRVLNRYGAVLNKAIHNGLTPLLTATLHGDAAIVRELGHLGVNLDQETHQGLTAVHLAVEYGEAEVLRALYEGHADLNKATNTGITPAHSAAKLGEVEMLRVLHECKANLNQKMINGVTPAYLAISEGKLEALREICTFYPDIDLENLIAIVLQTDHADILEFLISIGADIHRPYAFSSYELIAFCEGKDADVCSKVSEKITKFKAEGQDLSCLMLLPIEIASLYRNEKIVTFINAQKSAIKSNVSVVDKGLDEISENSIVSAKPQVATQLFQWGPFKGETDRDSSDPLESSVSLESFH